MRCSTKYNNMEACPFESTNRSRSSHVGLPGLNLSTSRHRTSAMSAMPMGAPGCPELAFWTASMDRARMALASSRRVGMNTSHLTRQAGHCLTCAPCQQCRVISVSKAELVVDLRRNAVTEPHTVYV